MITNLRAGILPKKATNVMKEMNSTMSAMVVKETMTAVVEMKPRPFL